MTLAREAKPANVSRLQWWAFGGCLIYGVALLLNSQVPNDQPWYLFDNLILRGLKLYHNLHVPFPPFYLLETSAWRAVLGGSWIATLVPPLAHLVLLTSAYFVLANKSYLVPWQKTIVFVGSFFVGTGCEFYHFGDYHVIPDIASLYSLVLLTREENYPSNTTSRVSLTVALGLLSGISLMTRLNDGLMLSLAIGGILYQRLSTARIPILALFGSTVFLTSATLISITHDTFQDFYKYAVVGATAIKGGPEQLILAPVKLIPNLISGLTSIFFLVCFLIFALVGTSALLVYRMHAEVERHSKPFRIRLVIAFLSLSSFGVVVVLSQVNHNYFIHASAPLFMMALYAAGGYATFIALRGSPTLGRRLTLILIPFGGLLSLSMSSAGRYEADYAPVGVFMVLLPYVWPSLLTFVSVRCYAFAIYSTLAVSGLLCKIDQPMAWENYSASTMFVGRGITWHPPYGYMIVDHRFSKTFDEVCDYLSRSPKRSLFSTPYSYANYYCDVPPWNNYVLTFFDTSSAETVNKIIAELGSSPPGWILYERQPRIIRSNEILFNHGRRLAHRDLEDFIFRQVESGKWKIVLYKHMAAYDYWYLIRTSSDVKPVSVGGESLESILVPRHARATTSTTEAPTRGMESARRSG